MSDHEGSVFTEDSDVDESQDSDTSGSEDTTGENNSTEGEASETEDEAEAESTESTLKSQEQEKAELTEKGTKLDADPLSRVNQELANERAKIRQYENVLNDPTTLRSYVAQFEKPGTQEQGKEPEMRVEDIQTTEDLQRYQRQQDTKLDSKLKELDSSIANVKSTQKDTAVATTIQSDITTIREQYPELNPKNNAYNPELDKAVGELYEMYDFDKASNSFKGQVSIKEIADKIMVAAGSSKKQGSAEAQTTIRDKRTGKAVSGASNTAPDESGMSTGQIIAQRIKAASGRR